MNTNRERSWSLALDLEQGDIVRLKNAIREELRYYNALVNGFSGPIRAMHGTLMSIKDKTEQLFAIVAGMRCNVRELKIGALPKALEPFADILFKDGKLALDSKTILIFDVASSVGNIPASVRMGIATEVLRKARMQATDLVANRIDSTLDTASSYKYAVTVLSPIGDGEKRHCQLPRYSVNVSPNDYDKPPKKDKSGKIVDEIFDITISVPYLVKPITMPKPPFKWSLLIIREDVDGRWVLEMSASKANYLVGKTDYVPRKKKTRT